MEGSSMTSKKDMCLGYLKRICQFKYPEAEQRRSVPHCAIYKFALAILEELQGSAIFTQTSAERLSSVAVILSFNFITDTWIASDDVTGFVCKCPLNYRLGSCRLSRCTRNCTRGCNCHEFEKGIGPLKLRIVSCDLKWSMFELYKHWEHEMYFMPCLPGQPCNDTLEGYHSLI